MNVLIDLAARRYPVLFALATRHLHLTLAAIAGLFIALALTLWARQIVTSDELFTSAGPIIGGDFIVFQHVAAASGGGDLAALYEMETLKAQLEAKYPGRGAMNFGWMYPPTMFLFIAPFGDGPYLVSYAAWVIAFAAIFLIVLYRLWPERLALFFVSSSPAFFAAVITGQNGFLTASLIAIAGGFAEKRPVLAGLAAGLLTIKPQLGILLPVAFIAAGCWRAFAAAAATAIALAALSVVAFGADLWVAFIEGLTTHGARLATDVFPFEKLVTPFGFAAVIGLPATTASAVQALASICLAGYVFIVWRRVEAPDIRLAALATAAIMATPYAFYYEFIIVAPAIVLVARRALATSWLRGEKLSLIALWLLTLEAPGTDEIPSIPVSALSALLAAAIVARRALPAAGVRFASASAPATAG
ncbi:MAG: glycosyltransferase family 87 protein [Parvularculaceae bacterium]